MSLSKTVPDMWPTVYGEHKEKGITLSCRRFTEDTVQTDLKEDKQQARDAQRTEKPMSSEVKPDTHRNSRLRPRSYQEPNKTNPGRKKRLEEGFEERCLGLGNLFDFPFLWANSQSTKRRQGGKNESAFNSQQKTSSAGTEICLREDWMANYKGLK